MSPRWLHWPAAAGGTTVYDTFTQANQINYLSGSLYYALNLVNGSWSSTGTATGTYGIATNSAGTFIVAHNVVRLAALGGSVASNPWPADKKVRVSLNNGTERTAGYNDDGNDTRYSFSWDGGDLTQAEIEPGGTLGWGLADWKIEVIDV